MNTWQERLKVFAGDSLPMLNKAAIASLLGASALLCGCANFKGFGFDADDYEAMHWQNEDNRRVTRDMQRSFEDSSRSIRDNVWQGIHGGPPPGYGGYGSGGGFGGRH